MNTEQIRQRIEDRRKTLNDNEKLLELMSQDGEVKGYTIIVEDGQDLQPVDSE